MKLHYKQEMKYLNAIADHLIEIGYEVEEPDTKYRDLLDVWGTWNGKKCYLEIYVDMYPIRNGGSKRSLNGIGGIWSQGDHEPVEVHLYDKYYDDKLYLYEIDDLVIILDKLKPFKKRKAAR